MYNILKVFRLFIVGIFGLITTVTAGTADIKGSIISFNGTAREADVGEFVRGLRATAKLKGFDIKVLENQFNQIEQDQQVQQILALDELPDAFIWWPVDDANGLVSLQALAETGVPILKINQLPNDLDKQYIIGFAGSNDSLRARNAGYMMREAAAARKAAGFTGFNVLVLSYPHSYDGYGRSIDAFKEAIAGSELKIIWDFDEGFGPENGYKSATKFIMAKQDQSIDFVYGMDDGILAGGIKALEESGIIIGKDVIAVGTVCNGDKKLIENGKQFGTTLQSPLLEGQLAIKLIEEYLDTGKLADFINFTPNPPITKKTIETAALRGFDGKLYSIEELCSGIW